ncbi:MAG: translocation/assembly module TamB domain-containing protein [Gammaproteobacteria bacterium]|nr:translocation/assembly module TamB domain-containing protein [Gammaproteobacteria bacterium]
MSRRRNPFRIALLVLLLLLPGTVALLLNTEAGLQWTVRLLQARVDGLVIGSASGRLAGPFVLNDVRWANGPEISLRRVSMEWHPTQLLWQGRIQVDRLIADGLRVRIEPDDTATEPPPPAGASGFRLALAIEVTRIELNDALIALGEAEPWNVQHLSARLHGSAGHVDIEELDLQAAHPQARLTGNARLPIDGRGAVAVDASVDGTFSGHHVRADLAAAGSTDALEFTVRSHAPLRAEAEGSGSLEGERPWQLTVSLAPFSSAELNPEGPALRIGGTTLEARGSGAGFTAQARSSVTEERVGTWEIDLNGGWNGSRWTLARLRAAEREGEGRITARARQDGARPTQLQGEAQWENLTWLDEARSDRGHLRLRGAPDAYHYEIDASISGREIPALALEARGSGDLRGTRIPALKAAWLDGTLTGDAELAWESGFEGRLALDVDNLDPGALRPELQGRVSARLELATGPGGSASRHHARIENLHGHIGRLPLRGQAHIELDSAGEGNAAADLAAGNASVRGSAAFGADWRIDWRLEAPELAALAPGMNGELRMQGSHRGPPRALHNRIDLQASEVARGNLHASAIEGYLDLTLAGSPRWQTEISANGARTGNLELGRIEASSEGTLASHSVRLRSRHDTLHFDQHLRGGATEGAWQGVLEEGHLVQVDVGTWTQRAPATIHLASSRRLTLERMCWDSVGAAICAALESTAPAAEPEPRHSAELEWSGLELRRLSTIVPLGTAEFAGISAGRISAAIDAGTIRAKVSARARDGMFRYGLPGEAGLQTLRYREARLDVDADDDGIHGTMSLALGDPDGSLVASLRMPDYTLPARPATGQALDLELAGDIALDAGSLFIPNIHLASGGRARIDLELSGTVGEPRLDGAADFVIGRLNILPLGSQLDDLRLNARFQDNTIALSGSGNMGDGALVIGGNGSFRTPSDWEANLALSGNDLAAVRVPTAQITASPNIAVRVTPRALDFDGSLTIPRAKLEPVRPESAISASDDVVVLGGPEADARAPLRLRGRLEFLLGDEVKISGRGFEGRLTGRTILIAARDSITAQGEIALVDGRYRAYGQNLAISQGRILYAGGPIANPAIDVIASRTRGENDEISVGVRVLGTAKAPTVTLYSSPTMDDADVLSWLVIGRPLSEARAGEGADLYQAATSVAIAGGGALAEKIGERFNLVEVSIEAGEQSEDTALVLGRSLSPRLYVRYIQGLMEDNNAIQFRYKLGRKWTLETESGTRTGAGADLLYSLER